jgi:hypothetical protein
MNHVVEHVERPIEVLRDLLDRTQLLYIRTPNRRSLLANIFGQKWRGWETPRHLQLFDSDSLKLTIERAGGCVRFMGTSNDMFAGVFVGSVGNIFSGKAKKVASAMTYIPAIWAAYAIGAGEELVAVASSEVGGLVASNRGVVDR